MVVVCCFLRFVQAGMEDRVAIRPCDGCDFVLSGGDQGVRDGSADISSRTDNGDV